MTSLPSGLASTSSRLGDSPQVRGADECGAELDAAMAQPYAGMDELAARRLEGTLTIISAIDHHSALALGAGYRSADRR